MSKIIHRDFTTNSINNTTSETLFHSFTIEKGTLKDDRLVRAELSCFIEQNTGASREIDFRIEVSDGTTTHNMTHPSVLKETGNADAAFRFSILGEDFDAQRVSSEFYYSTHEVGTKDEIYDRDGALDNISLDQSKDITVKFFVEMEIASANYQFTYKWSYVELV